MPDPQKTNRQAMPIATLQRIQAEKRGEVPVTPPPPGVPRRIPEYQHPSEGDIKRMRERLTLLERKITKSKAEQWMVGDRPTTKSNIINIINKTRSDIRSYIGIKEQLRRQHFDIVTGNVLWNEIPISERKYYPGSEKHFERYDKSERLKVVGGKKAVDEGVSGYYLLPPGIPMYKRRVLDKIQGGMSTRNAVLDVLWEERTQINPGDKFYDKLHPVEKMITSYFLGGESVIYGVVSLPEFALEEGVGRLLTGKKVDLPKEVTIAGVTMSTPFRREELEDWFMKRRVGPPGMIGQTISLATRGFKYTPEEKETFEKYPLETIAATFGEIAGMYAVKGVARVARRYTPYVAKTLVYKPLMMKFPKLKLYKPKIIEAVTRRKYIPEEQLLAPGQLAYSPSPVKTLGMFKAAKYKFIHATPTRFKPGTLLKRYVRPGEHPREIPGLFIAPWGKGQRLFLRIPKKPYRYEFAWVPKIKRPALVVGRLEEGIRRLPKILRKKPYEAIEYVKKVRKGPKAYISTRHERMLTTEPEAIIPAGPRAMRIPSPTGKEYFTLVEGKYVPLDWEKIFAEGVKIKPPVSLAFKGKTWMTERITRPYEPGVEYVTPPYTTIAGEQLFMKPYKPRPSKLIITKKPPIKIYPVYKEVLEEKVTTLPYKPSYVGYEPYRKVPPTRYKPISIIPPVLPPAAPYYEKRKPGKPIFPPPPKAGEIRKKPEIKPGYNVYAKKHATKPKRKWVQLNKQPLKEKQALGLGAKAVDASVARTFKIKKTKKQVVSKPHLDNIWYQKKHKFRKPIKKGKVQHESPLWIEKSKHLIDSPEEFKGITVEGWKAKQAKKQQKMFMYIGPPRSKK